MTKKEEFREWLIREYAFTETGAECVADKAEGIWGIRGNNSDIPSNLPSKVEFRSVWKHKVENADELYDWLIEQLQQPAAEKVSTLGSEVSTINYPHFPSKEEFLSQAKDDYCRGTGFNSVIVNLYEWVKEYTQQELTKIINQKEPTYKEIDFSMEEYQKGGYYVWHKGSQAEVKELTYFRTAENNFKYVGTLNGQVCMFEETDICLHKPVRKVKKDVIAVSYYSKEHGVRLLQRMTYDSIKDAEEFLVDYNEDWKDDPEGQLTDVQFHRISWTETEEEEK